MLDTLFAAKVEPDEAKIIKLRTDIDMIFFI
jgi:hypothetical protein